MIIGMENLTPGAEAKEAAGDIRINMDLFNRIFMVINEYQEELAHYLHVFGRPAPDRLERMAHEVTSELESAMDRNLEK